MELEFEIKSDTASADALQAALSARDADKDLRFEVRTSTSAYRVEPVVLVAIVSATGSALSALIGSIFGYVNARKARNQRIVLRGSDGTTVECPADSSPEQIGRLIEMVRNLGRSTIELP